MKWRVGVLLVLLVLRLVPGWVWVSQVQIGVAVKVRGDVVKIEQKGSNCIMRVGKFWVKTSGWCEFSRMDNVEVIGRTRVDVIDVLLGRIWLDGPNIILFAKNRENEGVVSDDKVGVWQGVREKLALNYQRLLPEPESSLVAGIVLGEKSRLPEKFYNALINTGTIHIVVASGYNVMVVGSMILGSLLYITSRRWATVGAVVGMLLYGLMAGADPPVVRAVIMGGVIFVGQAIGRSNKALWSLALAGWVMLMVEPLLIESVSFQLSVMASVGLFWLEPKLRRWFDEKEIENWILKTELLPTLAAQAMTIPVIWYHFGRISWISPLVNVLVLPLVPIIMAWGGVMLLLSLVWSPLGMVVGWLVYSLAHLVVVVVKWLG
ncbi:ComEC/Rec2 family competence protein [Patescibacteria group bacterium]|nr:ComEC/Rec2 family competence protein [Patescibacteria group bacterium]MBU1457882.1 ComEC/Rec2 family competence protein [Patescibacteria group bacterium]